MKAVRIGLITVGLTGIGWGGVLLAENLSVPDLIWLAVWLAGAIVIHDGIIVPALVLLRRAWRSRIRPRIVTITVEIAFAIGATLTLFVVPELWAQTRGSANPTILVGDYGLRLVLAWLVLNIATLAVVLFFARRLRRRSAGNGHGESTRNSRDHT